MARAVRTQFDMSQYGIDDTNWSALLEVDDSGMPGIIAWIRKWCEGNDNHNRVEEFLCILAVDDIIESNRLVEAGIDVVAQLIHLRIYMGHMILRRFDNIIYEVSLILMRI